jgi:RNA polymerase sigma factor (sigma-70 family)
VTEEDWAEHRPAVFGAAYRLLGTVSDAEDVEQDVWLRASSADLSGVRDLRAWLVTVAARLAYDVLRSARVRRETYAGPWPPEPLPTGPDASEPVLVDDSVSTAMLVVMERLSPPERVALVLHDVFEVPFERIAEVLGTTTAAGRQLASRARRRIVAAKESPRAGRPQRERVLAAFRAAYLAGDLEGLVALLHPGAVYATDGGGRVKAARKPSSAPNGSRPCWYASGGDVDSPRRSRRRWEARMAHGGRDDAAQRSVGRGLGRGHGGVQAGGDRLPGRPGRDGQRLEPHRRADAHTAAEARLIHQVR